MRISSFAAGGFLALSISFGCGGGGELPVAPTAEEAKKALDAAGPNAAAKAEPGVLKFENKYGAVEKKVDAPAPAKPQ